MLRRDETAAVREQCNQCDLAHVGGFAAHVRAGDQQHAASIIQRGVIGCELIHLRFHHRMPPLRDADLRLVGKLRRAEIQRGGAFGKGGEHIEFGDGGGDALQCRDVRRELIEQLFVKKFFARQCALVGGQRFVLEGLQLRRNVALGIFQCLAAAIIVRHVDRLCGGHFDIKTMHAVVFHFQSGDAGARAFACFQRQQKIAAVSLDAAQFIQLGIEGVSDYAAFS